jgi:hypothetical protein
MTRPTRYEFDAAWSVASPVHQLYIDTRTRERKRAGGARRSTTYDNNIRYSPVRKHLLLSALFTGKQDYSVLLSFYREELDSDVERQDCRFTFASP